MKEIIAHTVVHNGRNFELSLNFDDVGLVDGEFRVGTQVLTWPVDGPKEKADYVSAEISIKPDDDGRPILRIELLGNVRGMDGRRAVFEKPLSELLDVEQVLDWIPAWVFTGDPISGCLVRSGLSALVGQILDCKKDTSELHWYVPRMKALCRCMLVHIPEMTVTAATRAAKCVWRFGF